MRNEQNTRFEEQWLVLVYILTFKGTKRGDSPALAFNKSVALARGVGHNSQLERAPDLRCWAAALAVRDEKHLATPTTTFRGVHNITNS